MDALLFTPLASTVGASLDQVKLITCLLISYPLGSVFIRVPSTSPNLKHLFNILVSAIFFLPVLNLHRGMLELTATTLVTYFVSAYVQGPRMPWIVFGIVMGHMTVNHVIRAASEIGYETTDITGAQMVLTMKLTTFAWNVWDGRRPTEELDKWQLEHRVTEMPSIISFLGYAFYFPGVLVGPYLDFTSYMGLVNESIYVTAKGKEKAREDGRAVPRGRKRVAYRKMMVGLAWLGVYVVGSGSYNYGIVLEDAFLKKSMLARILMFQVCGTMERAKYYAVWTLTEGASILTGNGFTGYGPDGRSLWNGAANVDVALIEFAPNFKVLLDSWNMKTNIWLRECMYKRVTPKGKKPGFRSSMITFATSAFWHGIAFGYYLTFFLGGFIQTAGRLCRSCLRPLVLQPDLTTKIKLEHKNKTILSSPPEPPVAQRKRIYDALGTLCTVLLVNYATAPFMLLSFNRSIEGWSRLGWYGHWMLAVCLVFFYGGGRAWLKKVQAARVDKKLQEEIGDEFERSSTGSKTPGYVVPHMDLAFDEMDASVQRKVALIMKKD